MGTEHGFSRRKFISSGVALGGSALRVPSSAAARGGAGIAGRIEVLRDGIASNHVRDERLLKSMLSKLDRARDAVEEGDEKLAHSLLNKFIQMSSNNEPTDETGLTVHEERGWKQEARDIRNDLGCEPGPTEPTPPT
jgi:hypothetical protein